MARGNEDMVTACYSKQQNEKDEKEPCVWHSVACHEAIESQQARPTVLIAPSNFCLVKQTLRISCWIALKQQLPKSFRPSSSLAAKWLESRPLRSQTPSESCSHQRSSGHSLLHTVSTSNAPIRNLAVVFLPTSCLTRPKTI